MKNSRHRCLTAVPMSFETWVSGSFDPANFDHQTVETPTHFLKTYWEYKDLPNVHLFHYFDMKSDLRKHVAGLAEILHVTLNDHPSSTP